MAEIKEKANGIIRELVLTVNNTTASLNEPVHFYRGDRGIELWIKIQKFRYTFGKKSLVNMVDDSIIAARALITGPKHMEIKAGEEIHDDNDEFTENDHLTDPDNHGTCFEVKATNIKDNTIIIAINDKWVDEIHETGTHKIQIQLYAAPIFDEDGNFVDYERVTIPPVTFYVDEPICDLEEDWKNIGTIPEMPTTTKEYGLVEKEDGMEYVKYDFKTGQIIPYEVLDEMENALVHTTKGLNQEVKDRTSADAALNTRVDELTTYVDDTIHTSIVNVRNDFEEEIERVDGRVDTFTANINDHKTESDTKFTALNNSIMALDNKFTNATSDNAGRLNNIEYEIYTNHKDGNGKPLGIIKKIEVNATNIETVYREALQYAKNVGDSTLAESEEYTDTQINKEISARNERCDALQKTINDEIKRSTDADKELGDAVTTLIQNLGEEEKLRKSGDDALKDRIGSVELSVTNEVKNRNDADANLQSQINTEISDRTNADNALQASINEEITNRTNSDTAIYKAIESSNSNIAKNTTAIAKEISDREGAISLLDEKHTGLNNALRLEIDGNIKTAIDELETTIDNDIKTKLDELDKEIDTEIKTSIETLGNSVYTKEETDDKITWLQENIRGPQGTSILRYMGELNSVEELMNKPQIEGDSYIIGTTVYVCNGQDGPDPIWDPVELRGPQGFFYTPQITETVDEDGYKQMMLSWSNNAPDGLLANPETINVKGEPIKFVYGDEPEDKNNLWVVEAEEHDYTTKGYVDQSVEPLSNKIDEVESSLNELKGSGLLTSSSAKRVEFVTEFPQELEEDVLYILVEQIM